MFYVIIDSWNDVLYKTVGWSTNYYVAMVYYNQYKLNYPLAQLVHYNSPSVRSFYHSLKHDYDTEISDILSTELSSFTSKDFAIMAITTEKYREKFLDINMELISLIKEQLGATFLSVAPLMKYLDEKYADDFLTLAFVAYQCNNKSPNTDPVYIMYCILKFNYTKSIRRYISDNLIPNEMEKYTVFIFNK